MTKPETRKQLEARLENMAKDVAQARECAAAAKQRADLAERELKQNRKEIDDLKTRLQTSEAVNQRLRGYLDRVQEDDVVREELVLTGDPQGEQQLVSKRKHTRFAEQSEWTEFRDRDSSLYSYHDRQKAVRKHWVTY